MEYKCQKCGGPLPADMTKECQECYPPVSTITIDFKGIQPALGEIEHHASKCWIGGVTVRDNVIARSGGIEFFNPTYWFPATGFDQKKG